MTTLTINEIAKLATFAGLGVDTSGLDGDDMEAEITIELSPEDGVKGDTDKPIHYSGHIAWFTEIPEEGVMPLGEQI